MQIAQNLIFEASCTFLIDAGEIYGTGKTESGINVKLRSVSTLELAATYHELHLKHSS